MRRSRSAFHRWAIVALVIAWAKWPPVARADDERVNLRAEIGAEYDSNVHRTEKIAGTDGPAITGSPLARAVVGWSAADRIGTRQDVAFSILGAAKRFIASQAQNENVGIVDTAGSWRIAVGTRTRIGLGATYYEAVQAGTPTEQALSGEARDFRSLTPVLRLSVSVGDAGTAVIGAGYRRFVYKPLRAYDFDAPAFSASYRLVKETADGGADWDISVSAGVEMRRFAGPRLIAQVAGCTPATCTTIADPTGARHDDQFFVGRIDVTRTGTVLLGGTYAIQWNRSNSYGETLLRHVGAVQFATRLPLGIYLAARSELVYVSYADRVTVAAGPTGQQSASIDDENRSQVRAELTRDISARLQLVARYSLYLNPLGQADYLRHTGTLSVAFTVD
jgi:hypothetical protein